MERPRVDVERQRVVRERIYRREEELRRDPDVRRRGKDLYRELGSLSEEDLKKRCTI